MSRHSIERRARKLIGLLPTCYMDRMLLEQIFYLSSDFPHWLALFEEGSPLQTVAGNAIRAAIPIVAERLLECRDPDQLEVALDKLLDDSAVHRAYLQALAGIRSVDTEPLSEGCTELRPEVAQFLGTDAAKLISLALYDISKHAATYAGILSKFDEDLHGSLATQSEGTLGQVLLDPQYPVEMSRLMFQWTTGTLCGFAIVAAMMRQKRIADWLGLCLAERFLDGERAFLGFAQSIPELADPANPGPFDLDRMQQEHQAVQAWTRLSYARHRASGKSITPLFAADR